MHSGEYIRLTDGSKIHKTQFFKIHGGGRKSALDKPITYKVGEETFTCSPREKSKMQKLLNELVTKNKDLKKKLQNSSQEAAPQKQRVRVKAISVPSGARAFTPIEDNEYWLPANGCVNLEVSNYGRFRTLGDKKPIVPQRRGVSARYYVYAQKIGRYKNLWQAATPIVARTFNIQGSGKYIGFIDGDLQNLRANNLIWTDVQPRLLSPKDNTENDADQPKAKWRRVKSYKNIQVSTNGQFRNTKTKKLRALHVLDGYPKISLTRNDGKRVSMSAARLVKNTFDPINYATKLRYIDGNPHNIKLSNLAWRR